MDLEANFTVWSPDLSSMGFYVSGHLKEHIYTLLAKTIDDLMARIQTKVYAKTSSCARANAMRHTNV